MVLSEERLASRRTWTAFSVAAMLSGAAWMLFGAWPNHSDGGWRWVLPFIVALAGVAFLVGLVFPAAVTAMGRGLIVGPVVLAMWTTDRGDGDGLWGLMLPFVGVLAFYVRPVGWLAARLSVGIARGVPVRAGRRVLERDGALTAVIAGITSVFLVITFMLWPRPWADLERTLDRLQQPPGVLMVGRHRTGRWLESAGAGASYTFPREVTCAQARRALERWTGGPVREVRDAGWQPDGSCHFRGVIGSRRSISAIVDPTESRVLRVYV